ncbi:caspase family protein [Geodermatophilus amargosae]|uniref:caspase family protein n=1 Tax=Geodermatophilus amargosae TaxID=1296565 RepID=UPI0034DE1C6A
MAGSGYRALLIGNSTFPNDPGNLPTLEGPVNDIALLRDALTDPVTGLFDRHDVRLVAERTMSEILVELEQFFTSASRSDRLLLYYSGHGLLSVRNTLMLAARDTRTDSLLATTVSATSIDSMIDASAATTTMIVLDCCYSGSFKGADLPKSLEGAGRYLLTSTRSGQLAQDADRRNGTSRFTTHLVEGLRSGAPDHDGDGFVDLDDLYGYVHRQLAAIGRQIPQRSFSGGGDVVVARRPVPTIGKGHGVGAGIGTEGPPVLDVSETAIDLRDVDPEERLGPERVAVLNRGGGRLDWVATSDDEWLGVTRDGDDVRIELHPRPGDNRGAVRVRDRGPGGAKTIRVHVHVRQSSAPPPRSVPHVPRRPDSGGTGNPQSPEPAWWGGRRMLVGGLAALVLVVPGGVALSRCGTEDEGGGATGGATGTADPPPTATATAVEVDGTRLWTDTGVDVGLGDRVTVVAGGEVFHDVDAGLAIGPEGIPNRPELLTPYPELNHSALIVRVDGAGTPSPVGRQTTITAEGDGRLLLGVNDGGRENNAGFFTAEITVEPG